jgi:archaemetzincin
MVKNYISSKKVIARAFKKSSKSVILFLLVLLLMILTVKRHCPWMVYQYLSAAPAYPDKLGRVFKPSGLFRPLPKPERGDWLSIHIEQGQSFDEFTAQNWNTPDKTRNIIYLMAFERPVSKAKNTIDHLKEFVSAYYQMPVKIIYSDLKAAEGFTSRINSSSSQLQYLTDDILLYMKKHLPKDAYCMMGVTLIDLYPQESWNFVYGVGSLRERVGIFSLARYYPGVHGSGYDQERIDRLKLNRSDRVRIFHKRAFKVITHEIGHMFGMRHCIYFHCNENGSNHMKESDLQPIHFCPVCLRKIHKSIGFDPVKRYEQLKELYESHDLEKQAQWVSDRLEEIR